MSVRRIAVLTVQWQVTISGDKLRPANTVKPEEVPGSPFSLMEVLLYPAGISYTQQQPAGSAAFANHVLAHCPCACSDSESICAVTRSQVSSVQGCMVLQDQDV